jgi:hypothetical protein
MRYLLSKVLAALASRTWEHCVGFKIKKVLKYLPPEKQMPTTADGLHHSPPNSQFAGRGGHFRRRCHSLPAVNRLYAD